MQPCLRRGRWTVLQQTHRSVRVLSRRERSSVGLSGAMECPYRGLESLSSKERPLRSAGTTVSFASQSKRVTLQPSHWPCILGAGLRQPRWYRPCSSRLAVRTGCTSMSYLPRWMCDSVFLSTRHPWHSFTAPGTTPSRVDWSLAIGPIPAFATRSRRSSNRGRCSRRSSCRSANSPLAESCESRSQR